jgi:hypothetical protein
MDCHTTQHAILESFIEPLSADVQSKVDAHLDGCASCAVFAQRQRDLDRQLHARLVAPALSRGFRATVRARARRDVRGFWWDLLPDVVHFASCGGMTVLGLIWMPVSAPVVLASAVAATALTHVLLTAVHESLDAAQDMAS